MKPATWSDPNSHRLRKGRWSQPDGIYLVTFTTHGRKPLFVDHEAARLVSACIASAKHWPVATLLAWVLMPDHWHGLLRLSGDESLARAVARAKAAATRSLRHAGITSHPIWSSGFHDRALRSQDSILECARYIVANPVRAGIVAHSRDYSYWDAIWI